MLAAGRLPAAYLTLDEEPLRALAADDPAGFVAGLAPGTVIDRFTCHGLRTRTR